MSTFYGGGHVRYRLPLQGAFALMFFVAAAYSAFAGGGREAGEMITPEDAYKMANAGEAILVDVRDEASYVEAHIAGAVSVPLGQVAGRSGEFAQAGRTVITYCSCPAEETSIAAAGNLIAAGYSDVLVLKGGIQAWSAAGLPLRRGPRP